LRTFLVQGLVVPAAESVVSPTESATITVAVDCTLALTLNAAKTKSAVSKVKANILLFFEFIDISPKSMLACFNLTECNYI